MASCYNYHGLKRGIKEIKGNIKYVLNKIEAISAKFSKYMFNSNQAS